MHPATNDRRWPSWPKATHTGVFIARSSNSGFVVQWKNPLIDRDLLISGTSPKLRLKDPQVGWLGPCSQKRRCNLSSLLTMTSGEPAALQASRTLAKWFAGELSVDPWGLNCVQLMPAESAASEVDPLLAAVTPSLAEFRHLASCRG